MDEVNIERSWIINFLQIVAGFFLLLLISLNIIKVHSYNTVYTVGEVLFLVFFGLVLLYFGLWLIYYGITLLFSKKPYLTITSESVIAEGMHIIHFADVKSSFKIEMFRCVPCITYDYTSEAKSRRRFYYRKVRFCCVGTGWDAQEVCDLLNERLLRYRAAHKIN